MSTLADIIDQDELAALRALAGDVKTDPGPDYTGSAMIALYPPESVANNLAVQDGIPPEDLHVTLVFLGDAADVDRDALDGAMKEAIAGQGPLSGQYGGVGRFTGNADDGDAAIVHPDVPGLSAMRQRIVEALDRSGLPYSTSHDFTPHTTVAYIEPGEDHPLPRMPEAIPVSFDRVSTNIAGNRTDYPLDGTAADTAAPVTIEPNDTETKDAGSDGWSTGGASGGSGQGPFPKDGSYSKPHKYARSVHSGAGNCVCGAGEGDAIHEPPDERKDHPTGVIPTHAGLAVRAADTGRVLMLQRALDDEDPASGTWEFPGGKIEDGESAQEGAHREWSEETGMNVPDGTDGGTWTSPNGIYVGHVLHVPDESSVPINPGEPAVLNPDDPDGDNAEVAAWFDPRHLPGMASLRPEVQNTPWPLLMLGPDENKAIVAAYAAIGKPYEWGGGEVDIKRLFAEALHPRGHGGKWIAKIGGVAEDLKDLGGYEHHFADDGHAFTRAAEALPKVRDAMQRGDYIEALHALQPHRGIPDGVLSNTDTFMSEMGVGDGHRSRKARAAHEFLQGLDEHLRQSEHEVGSHDLIDRAAAVTHRESGRKGFVVEQPKKRGGGHLVQWSDATEPEWTRTEDLVARDNTVDPEGRDRRRDLHPEGLTQADQDWLRQQEDLAFGREQTAPASSPLGKVPPHVTETTRGDWIHRATDIEKRVADIGPRAKYLAEPMERFLGDGQRGLLTLDFPAAGDAFEHAAAYLMSGDDPDAPDHRLGSELQRLANEIRDHHAVKNGVKVDLTGLDDLRALAGIEGKDSHFESLHPREHGHFAAKVGAALNPLWDEEHDRMHQHTATIVTREGVTHEAHRIEGWSGSTEEPEEIQHTGPDGKSHWTPVSDIESMTVESPSMTEKIPATAIRQGDVVRRLPSHDLQRVAEVRPTFGRGSKPLGARVTFDDGTSTTSGLGALWERQHSVTLRNRPDEMTDLLPFDEKGTVMVDLDGLDDLRALAGEEKDLDPVDGQGYEEKTWAAALHPRDHHGRFASGLMHAATAIDAITGKAESEKTRGHLTRAANGMRVAASHVVEGDDHLAQAAAHAAYNEARLAHASDEAHERPLFALRIGRAVDETRDALGRIHDRRMLGIDANSQHGPDKSPLKRIRRTAYTDHDLFSPDLATNIGREPRRPLPLPAKSLKSAPGNPIDAAAMLTGSEREALLSAASAQRWPLVDRVTALLQQHNDSDDADEQARIRGQITAELAEPPDESDSGTEIDAKALLDEVETLRDSVADVLAPEGKAGRWDPKKHPRDKNGKFASIGAVVNAVLADGRKIRGEVTGHDDKGNVTVDIGAGKSVKVASRQTEVIGHSPADAVHAAQHAKGATDLDKSVLKRASDTLASASLAGGRGDHQSAKAGRQRAASILRQHADHQEGLPPAGGKTRSLTDVSKMRQTADKITGLPLPSSQPNRPDGGAWGSGYQQGDPRSDPAYDRYVADLDAKVDEIKDKIGDTRALFDRIDGSTDKKDVYQPERAAQHREILNDVMAQVVANGVPKNRQAIVLAGLPGAGKSTILTQKGADFGVRTANGEPVSHAVVNPDLMKEELVKRGMIPDIYSPAGLGPGEVAPLIHEESSHLADLLRARLAREGYDVILDGTFGGEHGKQIKKVTDLKSDGYKVGGVLVDSDYVRALAQAGSRHRNRGFGPNGEHLGHAAPVPGGSALPGRYAPAGNTISQGPTGATSEVLNRVHGSRNSENFESAIPLFDNGWHIYRNEGGNAQRTHNGPPLT